MVSDVCKTLLWRQSLVSNKGFKAFAALTWDAPNVAPLNQIVRHQMKFHDYHIKEYTVSDRGETITFDLVFGYPNNETDRSIIKFTGVALYNFTHTCNAIITDIYEVAISEILQENRHSITEWNRMHGIEGFQENVEQYSKYLQSKGLTAWCIESAIGFYGFVIAKAVKNA